MTTALVVKSSAAQATRKLLEQHGLWDKTRRMEKIGVESVAIPIIRTADLSFLAHHLNQDESNISVIETHLPSSKGQVLVTPAQRLLQTSAHLFKENVFTDSEQQRLLLEVPRHWEKHGNLILLPAKAFRSQEWSVLGKELWVQVAICLGANRVARKTLVIADGFRSPQVTLLLGSDGMVQHIDNGIRYEYDITKCMFSSGNITEKLRIADFSCDGEVVVDLYAGIGYFTLPYLVHARAKHVHACEWNPHAVAALKRNLMLNKVHHSCTVHQGDNRKLTLRGVADRVNLGLIPSSEDGWPMACRVLKPTGGILHVHGNINGLTAAGEKLQVCPGADNSKFSECGPQELSSQSSAQPTSAEMQLLDLEKKPESQMCTQGRERISEQTLKKMSLQIANKNSAPNKGSFNSSKSSNSGDIVNNVGSECDSGCNEKCDTVHMMNNIGSEYDSVCSEKCDSMHIVKNVGSECDSVCNENSGTVHMVNNMAAECNDLCNEKSGTVQIESSSLPNVRRDNNQLTTHSDTEGPGNVLDRTAIWWQWGYNVCSRLKTLLEKEHGGFWRTSLVHLHPVKSYAPHIQHVVLDVHCFPEHDPHEVK